MAFKLIGDIWTGLPLGSLSGEALHPSLPADVASNSGVRRGPALVKRPANPERAGRLRPLLVSLPAAHHGVVDLIPRHGFERDAVKHQPVRFTRLCDLQPQRVPRREAGLTGLITVMLSHPRFHCHERLEDLRVRRLYRAVRAGHERESSVSLLPQIVCEIGSRRSDRSAWPPSECRDLPGADSMPEGRFRAP